MHTPTNFDQTVRIGPLARYNGAESLVGIPSRNQCWVLDSFLGFGKVLDKFWTSFGHIKAVQNLSKTCPKLRVLDKLPNTDVMILWQNSIMG
jgi:hypothetical protein